MQFTIPALGLFSLPTAANIATSCGSVRGTGTENRWNIWANADLGGDGWCRHFQHELTKVQRCHVRQWHCTPPPPQSGSTDTIIKFDADGMCRGLEVEKAFNAASDGDLSIICHSTPDGYY